MDEELLDEEEWRARLRNWEVGEKKNKTPVPGEKKRKADAVDAAAAAADRGAKRAKEEVEVDTLLILPV